METRIKSIHWFQVITPLALRMLSNAWLGLDYKCLTEILRLFSYQNNSIPSRVLSGRRVMIFYEKSYLSSPPPFKLSTSHVAGLSQ